MPPLKGHWLRPTSPKAVHEFGVASVVRLEAAGGAWVGRKTDHAAVVQCINFLDNPDRLAGGLVNFPIVPFDRE